MHNRLLVLCLYFSFSCVHLDIYVTVLSGYMRLCVCVFVTIQFARMLCGHFVKVITYSLPVQQPVGLKQDELKGGAGRLPSLSFSLPHCTHCISISHWFCSSSEQSNYFWFHKNIVFYQHSPPHLPGLAFLPIVFQLSSLHHPFSRLWPQTVVVLCCLSVFHVAF